MSGVSESPSRQGLWGWAPRDCFGVWPGLASHRRSLGLDSPAWLVSASPGTGWRPLQALATQPGSSEGEKPLGGAPRGCPSDSQLGWGAEAETCWGHRQHCASQPRSALAGIGPHGPAAPSSADSGPPGPTGPRPLQTEAHLGLRSPISLDLSGTHFLCLTTEVLTWSGRTQLCFMDLTSPGLPRQAFSSDSGPGVQAEFWKGQAAPAPSLGSPSWSCEVLPSSLG